VVQADVEEVEFETSCHLPEFRLAAEKVSPVSEHLPTPPVLVVTKADTPKVHKLEKIQVQVRYKWGQCFGFGKNAEKNWRQKLAILTQNTVIL
jgi:hypothetical protein